VRKNKMITLKTTQDYLNLYDKMGCIDLMTRFFHKWDNKGGRLCRTDYLSKAYALSKGIGMGNNLMYCKPHAKSHRPIYGKDDDNIKILLSICPEYHNKKDPEKKDIREHPRYFDGVKDGNLVQPGYLNFDIRTDIHNSRTIHFLQFLWNDDGLDFRNRYPNIKGGFKGLSQEDKERFITHFVPVLEIDCANKKKNGEKNGDSNIEGSDKNSSNVDKIARYNRLDIFNKDVWEDFVIADGYVTDKFKGFFGEKGFYKIFSANGLYYIGNPIKVSSINELMKVRNGWVYKFCTNIENYFSSGGGGRELRNLHFDNPFPAWNSFYKIPFSMHKAFDRIVIPLSRKGLDYDYIVRFSNPDNLNIDVCNDIWKKSGL
jgi:hypothetical protein